MTTELLKIKIIGGDRALVWSSEYKNFASAMTARCKKRKKNDGYIWEIWSDKSMDMNNPDIEYQCIDSTEWYK